MCVKLSSGIFCQTQEKFIEAEMAFREANKQLNAALQNESASRPEITSETQSGQKKDQKDESSETPAGNTEETGDHLMSICSVTKAYHLYLIWDHLFKGGDTDEDDAVHEEDRPQNSQESKQEVQQQIPPKSVQTTIYMETVWFLLQNYALQVTTLDHFYIKGDICFHLKCI